MDDKEKIKLLERQIELLENIIELQKSVAPVYPYQPYPSHPQPWIQPWVAPWYGDGTRITC